MCTREQLQSAANAWQTSVFALSQTLSPEERAEIVRVFVKEHAVPYFQLSVPDRWQPSDFAAAVHRELGPDFKGILFAITGGVSIVVTKDHSQAYAMLRMLYLTNGPVTIPEK